jgi:RES domain-containing protein
MLVYRITPKIYSHSLFAPGLAGRWNGNGRKVIYTAESIPIAFMENMIRRKGLGFNDQFAIMFIEVPDILSIIEVDPVTLAAGWRDYKDYSICQAAGNDWYDKRLSPILKVPSAVLPTNFNYVLNAEHTDFPQIKLITTSELLPDDRIEDLLKKYDPT